MRPDKRRGFFVEGVEITERREPRTIAAMGISTDGYRCAVRRGSMGEVVSFGVHRGKELSADNVKLISAPQLMTAAFALEADGAKGYIDLVATSTVQLRLPGRPRSVIAGERNMDFAFHDEDQLVTFALPSGGHRVLVRY